MDGKGRGRKSASIQLAITFLKTLTNPMKTFIIGHAVNDRFPEFPNRCRLLMFRRNFPLTSSGWMVITNKTTQRHNPKHHDRHIQQCVNLTSQSQNKPSFQVFPQSCQFTLLKGSQYRSMYKISWNALLFASCMSTSVRLSHCIPCTAILYVKGKVSLVWTPL